MTEVFEHDVIVIGAGLAGLSAALKLQQAGVDAVVLEAQDRVGGRVHSMRQLGSNKEAGGTYIGAGYTRIIGAAERYGVDLIDVTPMLKFFREQELVLDGEIIRQADWPDHPANLFSGDDREIMPWAYHRLLTVRENPLSEPGDWLSDDAAKHDVSAYDWLKSIGFSDDAVQLAYGMNVSFGENAHDVSALLLFFRAAFSVAQRKLAPEGVVGYTARNGVARIPEAMAEALTRPAQLGKVVTAIDGQQQQAEVHCTDGSRYRAPHVICSLPFSVLRDIDINPKLQGQQAEAVSTLPSQAMTQVYLAHKSNFWEADGYTPSLFTDGIAGMVAGARNGEDPEEVTSFTSWTLGPNASLLDTLSPEDAGRRVIEAIESARPAAKGQLEFLGIQSWGSDAFARGGWAYFRPGEIQRFASCMGDPHGQIRFCGEHLAQTSRGMEGAMESGERAAAEILSL
ncbi:MAG: flavin monoamine oxidase family protein [Candidatus Rariloculaceae bacterium]